MKKMQIIQILVLFNAFLPLCYKSVDAMVPAHKNIKTNYEKNVAILDEALEKLLLNKCSRKKNDNFVEDGYEPTFVATEYNEEGFKINFEGLDFSVPIIDGFYHYKLPLKLKSNIKNIKIDTDFQPANFNPYQFEFNLNPKLNPESFDLGCFRLPIKFKPQAVTIFSAKFTAIHSKTLTTKMTLFYYFQSPVDEEYTEVKYKLDFRNKELIMLIPLTILKIPESSETHFFQKPIKENLNEENMLPMKTKIRLLETEWSNV